MNSNELAVCREIEDLAREKGLKIQSDLIDSVIQGKPEYVDCFFRSKELMSTKESPVNGLKQEDFYRYARQNFSITLRGTDEESIEQITEDWVNRNFRRSWAYSIAIWCSEFRNADRMLDLLFSELKTRSDEYQDWVMSLAGEAVCEC